MNVLFSYGQCHLCGGKIIIPGFDAFLCGGECNQWVTVQKTPHQILPPLPISPAKTRLKSSENQLSLLETGGEA